MLSLLRRTLLGLMGVVLGLAAMTSVGRGDEVGVRCSAPGFVIHGPEETLRDHCMVDEGRLYFVAPEGSRFELVTSTSDPAISNPGSGAFHPFDESVVRSALSAVRYPIEGLAAHVFLLPYPRRSSMVSAAGHELILLSPGVWPLSVEQQHSALAHELGHVVQYALMPDEAEALWTRYRSLRGIVDQTRYHADGLHADRPHEIFAEDFRALFGGSFATYSGTIENASLTHPSSVGGLDAFLTSLSGGQIALAEIRGYPNPARGAMSFRRNGGEPEPLDVFDASGRRLITITPTPLADGWLWRWDGRDDQGRPAAPGVVFARSRSGATRTERVTILR